MNQFFRQLGIFAVRFRWVIVVTWVVITIASVKFFPGTGTITKSGNSSFLPNNSLSSKALALAAPFQNTQYASLTLAVARADGPLSAADQATIDQVEAAIRAMPLVQSLLDTGTSPDGAARQAAIQADVPQQGGGTADQLVQNIRALLHTSSATSGLQMHLTGQLPLFVDNTISTQASQGATTSYTIVFIIVFLLLIFRSPLAPLITLLPAGLVVALAGPVVTGAANLLHFSVSTFAPLLMIVLVLGAGTDYALFLIYRVREELRKGLPPAAAVEQAVSTVGETLAFSAFTVIVALLSLLTAQFGIYASLGPTLAIGIFLMLLAGLTLLPALLAIFGRAVFWPISTQPMAAQPVGWWGGLTKRLVQRPVLTLLIGVVVFGGLALGTINSSIAGLGLLNIGPVGADSTLGSDLLAHHFPAPSGNLTQIFLRYTQPIWSTPNQFSVAQDQVSTIAAVQLVLGPLTPNGISLTEQQLTTLHQTLGVAQLLPPEEPAAFQPTVSAMLYNAYRSTVPYISEDGRTLQFVTLLDPKQSGTATAPALRQSVQRAGQLAGAAQSGVFGTDELAYDVNQITNSDLSHIIPLVAFLIALLLALVLRSLVAPLYLVVSVVLSYLAALGLIALIFVHLRGQDGIQFILPFLLFVFLMALGSDYNILVMTRIREEAHTKPLRQAVQDAVGVTGTTVTTAGLVLAGTFAVLGFAAGNAEQIQQIGFGIAAGILMDTFLVRTLLVPAMVVLLGRWNWWPSPLFASSVIQEKTHATGEALLNLVASPPQE